MSKEEKLPLEEAQMWETLKDPNSVVCEMDDGSRFVMKRKVIAVKPRKLQDNWTIQIDTDIK